MDRETRTLERIAYALVISSFLMVYLAGILEKEIPALFFLFCLFSVMSLEMGNVVARNKSKKKTFNGGKPYNPYRPFSVIMMIFTLLIAILKILEAAELITL